MTALITEYYSVPFYYLHDKFHSKLGAALLLRPKEVLKKALFSKFGGNAACLVSWDDLFNVLESLEKEMKKILEKRTIFFWRHLYRRLAPTLPEEMGGKVDWVTKGLVRDIVETAIQKHGSLTRKSEFSVFKETAVDRVLGGWFLKAFKEAIKDRNRRSKCFELFRSSPQMVVVDFSPLDLTGLYFVEGLAYEYWRLTAKLRAIGKGAELYYTESEGLHFSSSNEIWKLFASYDSRAETHNIFDGSSLGVWLQELQAGNKVLTFSPNVQQIDLSPVFADVGLIVSVEKGGFLTNYIPGFFNADAFACAHEYISESFADKKGYSLKALAVVFEVITECCIAQSQQAVRDKVGDESVLALAFLNLCKRAYTLASNEVYQEIRRISSERIALRLALSEGDASAQADRILCAIQLTELNRQMCSLWSRGPRLPISALEDGFVLDMYGIHQYFHNAFVGVREDYAARGFIFEERVRDEMEKRSIDLQARNFTFLDGSKREADAVFYIGQRLVLVDCLSIWRPLDFDVSRPKTMIARQRELQKKIQQAGSCAKKVSENPVGRNFDFSKAESFSYVVVTPFVEWIWEKTADLWIDDVTPRIMRVNEFLEWAERERAAAAKIVLL
jgi:hypothetical protein